MARDLFLREIPEDDGGMDVCTTCGGAGEIHVAINGWDEDPEYELAPCPTCFGKGISRPIPKLSKEASDARRRARFEQNQRALDAAVARVEAWAAGRKPVPAEDFMDQSEEERLKASE